jgi:hypothetical protein
MSRLDHLSGRDTLSGYNDNHDSDYDASIDDDYASDNDFVIRDGDLGDRLKVYTLRSGRNILYGARMESETEACDSADEAEDDDYDVELVPQHIPVSFDEIIVVNTFVSDSGSGSETGPGNNMGRCGMCGSDWNAIMTLGVTDYFF